MSVIRFEKTTDIAIMPRRATKGSVGYDFFTFKDIEIHPYMTVIVNTGIRCFFPDSYWLGIYGRSSFAIKGLINPLGVGVIDSDYYGTGNDIRIVLFNNSSQTVNISKGEAIGQGIFHRATTIGDTVDEERTGGFGSTDSTEQDSNTILFKGELLEYRRAKLFIHEKCFSGVIIPTPDGSITHTFISDEEYPKFHSGDDNNYSNRCWWVNIHRDENLTIE